MLHDLLAALPTPITTDPLPQGALSVGYDGGCWLQIGDDTLRTTTTGGSGEDLLIRLRGLSLPDLAAQLAAAPGYTAAILDGFSLTLAQNGIPPAQIGAWALLDTIQDLGTSPWLSVSQSVLIGLLKMANAGIQDSRRSVGQILPRAQIDQATDIWLDDWGTLYGIPRNPGETDADYRNRIILQLIAPRCNNEAIRAIVRQAWQVADAAIEDDLTPATDADAVRKEQGLPYHRLNPYRFQTTTQLAEFGGFSGNFAGLVTLVTAIKAWGTSFEPRVLGSNVEQNRRQGSDATPWIDAFLHSEAVDRLLRDTTTLGALLQTFETPRTQPFPFLLTIRPTGQSATLPWDNGADDGNALRTTIRPQTAPAFTAGYAQALQSWVTTFGESWADADRFVAFLETAAGGSDGWFGDFLTSVVESVRRLVDARLPDTVAHVPPVEQPGAIPHFIRANNIFSRANDARSRILARPNGHTLLQDSFDFWRDAIT